MTSVTSLGNDEYRIELDITGGSVEVGDRIDVDIASGAVLSSRDAFFVLEQDTKSLSIAIS